MLLAVIRSASILVYKVIIKTIIIYVHVIINLNSMPDHIYIEMQAQAHFSVKCSTSHVS